jgi:hypothetical protein
MCNKTPVLCQDDGSELDWVSPGASVCKTGDHSIWLPTLVIPDGYRFNVNILKGRGAVVFQEECENCQWPPVDHRFLPDPEKMPILWPGTLWRKARDLDAGMQIHMGFGYALTVTHVETRVGDAGQPDRTCLTVAPPAGCGEPFDFHTFADSPECVEGDR